MAKVLGFPRTVNEKAARTVAGGALAIALLTVATGWFWLTIPLAYGFWARVLTGPTLSPLGQLATRVVAPRLGAPQTVPGPPKRFAQAMGVVMSTTALVLRDLPRPDARGRRARDRVPRVRGHLGPRTRLAHA
jgi:hypothetical protein